MRAGLACDCERVRVGYHERLKRLKRIQAGRTRREVCNMKVALAQIDMRLGDIDGICERIETQVQLAAK